MTWPIAGWQQISYCDWPGRITTVLFLPNCDLHCPTCHNKTIAHPNEKLLYFSLDNIIKFLNDKKKWIDGIVISGGEPLMYLSIIELCKFLKKNTDMVIKLDTNGMHPDIMENIINENVVDTIAMDIKAPYYLYPDVTGMPDTNVEYFKETIEKSLKLLVNNRDKINAYFRTTKVPLVDTPDILKIIKSYVPENYDYRLQPFVKHNDS